MANENGVNWERTFRHLLLTLVVASLIYFLVIIWSGWEESVALLRKLGWRTSLLILALVSIGYVFRFFRWHYFLYILGHHVPLLPSFRYFLAGFAFTATPGKAGEGVRGILLKQGYGLPLRRSLSVLFSERLSDLISLLLLSSTMLWSLREGHLGMLIFCGAILAFLIILQKRSWLLKIEHLLDRCLPERFASSIDLFLDTVMSVHACFRIPSLLTGLFLGGVSWFLEGVGLQMILSGLGYELDLMPILAKFCFALVIGIVTFIPGGFGTMEATLIELLRWDGVAFSDAVVATLLIRLFTIWYAIALGLAAFPYRSIARKQ